MKYSETSARFGENAKHDNGDEPRAEHKDYVIKGFSQDGDTFLKAINKLIWAKNEKMENLYTKKKECWADLD